MLKVSEVDALVRIFGNENASDAEKHHRYNITDTLCIEHISGEWLLMTAEGDYIADVKDVDLEDGRLYIDGFSDDDAGMKIEVAVDYDTQ